MGIVPPYQDILLLRKDLNSPHVYDVNLANLDEVKRFDSLECHLVLYPYSRKINSSHIFINPFEEYIKDIYSNQRSAYTRINPLSGHLFGFFLGVVILITFWIWKPSELASIESIVAVFGAYIIGKDIWKDLEEILEKLTKTWRLRYRKNSYLYQQEKASTLTNYTYFAKEQRYEMRSLLPEKIDFIELSNSQTVRMFFNLTVFAKRLEKRAHILSVHVDRELRDEFKTLGALFGAKVSFNRSLFGCTKSHEYFQSLNRGFKGCLDSKGQWRDGSLYYRISYSWGRLKYTCRGEIIQHDSLIRDDVNKNQEET